jgi:YHS domain-containing protein
MKNVNVIGFLLGMFVLTSAAMGEDPKDDTAEQAKRDQLLAAVQQICPVTGNKLGEHGTPVKVKIGKEEVFLCCKSCVKGKVEAKHWATIHSNFAKAQGSCPVMKKALPKNAKWTIVNGRVVYVCCPPCIKKIESEPEKYLKIVDQSYSASLKPQKAR